MVDIRYEKWPNITVKVPIRMKVDLVKKLQANRECLPAEDDRCSASSFLRLLLRRELYGSEDPTDEEKEFRKLQQEGVLLPEMTGDAESNESIKKWVQSFREQQKTAEPHLIQLRALLNTKAMTAVELSQEMGITRQYVNRFLHLLRPKPRIVKRGRDVWYTLGPMPLNIEPANLRDITPSGKNDVELELE